jgi:hypothetical protein
VDLAFLIKRSIILEMKLFYAAFAFGFGMASATVIGIISGIAIGVMLLCAPVLALVSVIRQWIPHHDAKPY